MRLVKDSVEVGYLAPLPAYAGSNQPSASRRRRLVGGHCGRVDAQNRQRDASATQPVPPL